MVLVDFDDSSIKKAQLWDQKKKKASPPEEKIPKTISEKLFQEDIKSTADLK